MTLPVTLAILTAIGVVFAIIDVARNIAQLAERVEQSIPALSVAA